MRMITWLSGALFVSLATGALADNKFYRWTDPLPEAVEQNLPADIPARDVLVQDGCFYYVFEGEVFQLLQTGGGAKGLPVCIG